MAKSKHSPGLLADVTARVEAKRCGYPSWFEKLPPDAQQECVAVRAAFRRGEIGSKAAVARALISAARERGWAISAEKQVCLWLVKHDD